MKALLLLTVKEVCAEKRSIHGYGISPHLRYLAESSGLTVPASLEELQEEAQKTLEIELARGTTDP